LLLDSDGDGWPNGVEWALGTDPYSAASYPVGLPPLPAPAPDLPATTPALAPKPNGFLVNVPGVIAIGMPGSKSYTTNYVLSIDLGMGAAVGDVTGNDLYVNAPGLNGIAIDLGGNDIFAPAPVGGKVPPAFGALNETETVNSQYRGLYTN